MSGILTVLLSCCSTLVDTYGSCCPCVFVNVVRNENWTNENKHIISVEFHYLSVVDHLLRRRLRILFLLYKPHHGCLFLIVKELLRPGLQGAKCMFDMRQMLFCLLLFSVSLDRYGSEISVRLTFIPRPPTKTHLSRSGLLVVSLCVAFARRENKVLFILVPSVLNIAARETRQRCRWP
jgi:hypothetical protein